MDFSRAGRCRPAKDKLTDVGYLLNGGFQVQPFHCRVMTEAPFGRFNHYINTSPMLFL